MSRGLLSLLAVAVLTAAACGGSADEPDPGGGSQDEGAAGAIALKALDFSFDPEEISVDPGESVSIELTNGGGVAHSFTAEAVNVDVTAEPGGTAVAGFDAPDEDTTIGYVCRFHPDDMHGTITVGAGGGAGSGGSSEDEGAEDYDY